MTLPKDPRSVDERWTVPIDDGASGPDRIKPDRGSGFFTIPRLLIEPGAATLESTANAGRTAQTATPRSASGTMNERPTEPYDPADPGASTPPLRLTRTRHRPHRTRSRPPGSARPVSPPPARRPRSIPRRSGGRDRGLLARARPGRPRPDRLGAARPATPNRGSSRLPASRRPSPLNPSSLNAVGRAGCSVRSWPPRSLPRRWPPAGPT